MNPSSLLNDLKSRGKAQWQFINIISIPFRGTKVADVFTARDYGALSVHDDRYLTPELAD